MKQNLDNLVFQIRSTTEFLNSALAGTLVLHQQKKRKPRGSLTRLAAFLRCHTSFLAQVLSGHTQLSVDQAMLCADYFGLDQPSKDQFLLLLLSERCGADSVKGYFLDRLQKKKRERENLAKRWEVNEPLGEHQSLLFYSSWLHQAVFSLVHLPSCQSVEALAVRLGILADQTRKILAELCNIGLIEPCKDFYRPNSNFLHLKMESRTINLLHQTWRIKSAEHISRSMDSKGLHYSGAITISNEDSKFVKQDLLKLLDRVKKRVFQSESEECLVLLIDYFPLT